MFITSTQDCICGKTKAGVLIRCDSCLKWFHSECVGVGNKVRLSLRSLTLIAALLTSLD